MAYDILKALQSFETPGSTHLVTQRHIPKDMNRKQQHCENQSCTVCLCYMLI